MKELNLTRPQAGQSSVVSASDVSAIAFDFNMAEAHFGRSGSDLTIGFGADAQISISDFFTPGAAGSLENIKLGNGEVVSAQEFLRVLSEDFNIETAADKASADGSGVSDYRDDGGSLLDGVNRLGLGDDLNQWSLEDLGREYVAEAAPRTATTIADPISPPPVDPPPVDPPVKPPLPTPDPTPDYFVLIGHAGPVEGAPVAEYIAAFSSHNPSGDVSSLAGGTTAQVDVSDWDKWTNGNTGEEGPYYEFLSANGNTVLYNPATGYFGYFPENAVQINDFLKQPGTEDYLEAQGYYYDFFFYTVIEDGETSVKIGHVLYVNDSVYPNIDDAYAALVNSGSAEQMLAAMLGEAQQRIDEYKEQLQSAQENCDWYTENYGEVPEWALNAMSGYRDAIQTWESLAKELQGAIEDKLNPLADLGSSLGHPELTEGSNSICAGHESLEEHLVVEPGGELPPYVDLEFGLAGFEEFLAANSNYITSVGALAGASVSGSAGDDLLVLNNDAYDTNIDMGSGNDTVKIDASYQDYGYYGYDRMPYNSVIDGGESEVDKEHGRLGDVLSFSSNDVKEWGSYFEDVAYSNTIKNFDALHLDLTNGEQETLINLDALLGKVNGLQSEGKFSSVVITGDKDDMALLNEGAWTKGETVDNLQGFEGQFVHYTGSVEGQEMDLYIAIQQNLQSLT